MRSAPGALGPVALTSLALLLAACAGTSSSTSLGQQVQSWARTSGLDVSLRTLEADARRVRVVASGSDTTGLGTVCDVLVTDALSANQNLPSPDGVLNSILSAAYRAAAAAGRGCLRGAGAQRGLPAAWSGDLTTAQAGYVKAQARVDLDELPGGGGS